MINVTFDAGALIAVERRHPGIRALLRQMQAGGLPVHIPAGALAQAWRNHPRQHALHVLLGADHVEVVPLGLFESLAAGALCAAKSSRDIVDASVVTCAQDRGSVVITSDPDDIAALDPTLQVMTV